MRELGVEAFPHVGKNTEIDVRGKKIFPLVTGTFGMTDFLHSVVGEMGDKMAQSEVEDMESKLNDASEKANRDDQASVIKDILDKVPWDMLEGDGKPDPSKADELKQAASAKAEETNQRPLDSNVSLGGMNIEEAKDMAQQTLKDMYPILEFHDQIMKGVTTITSKVPGLDELLENMSGALQIFIFSLLAPYVKPIISQARVELKATSEGVLKSSQKRQYEVFENDSCTDPTHSMLSKDHFSNVLNPVAGQVACATVKFAVPHIVDSWSDEGKDARQVIDDILQVFHHPALRDENRQGQKAMFETVRQWWEGKDDSEKQHLKEILSYDGVKDGKNHSGDSGEGGHSHGAPPKKKKQEDSGIVPSAQEGASFLSQIAGGITNLALKETGLDEKLGTTGLSSRTNEGRSNRDEETSYGRENESSSYGRGNNESSSHRRNDENEQTSSHSRRNDDENTSYGRGNDNETSSYGRNNNESSSYGRANAETSSYGRETESSSYGRGNNESSSYGRNNDNEQTSSYSRRNDDENTSYGRGNDNETSSYGRTAESSSYSRSNDDTPSYGRNNDNERTSYGQNESSYGRSNDDTPSYGRNTDSYGETQERSERRGGGNGYGEREETSYGRSGRDENEENSYSQSGRGGSGYGEREEGGYGGRSNEGRRHGQDENSGY